MRTILASIGGVLMLGLLLFLVLRGGGSSDEGPAPAVAPAPQAAAPADLPPVPAARPPVEPDLASPDEGRLPEVASAPDAASRLEQTYREAAKAARERVAGLSRSARSTPRREDYFRDLLRRPGPDAPLRDRWDEVLGPLFYPEGHPRAGQPLDSVRPEDLAAAADELVLSQLPEESRARPTRRVRLQQSFYSVQKATRRLGTGRAFADWVDATPPDPDAAVYDPYWIKTDPDDPKGRPLAEHLSELNLEEATALIEATRDRD